MTSFFAAFRLRNATAVVVVGERIGITTTRRMMMMMKSRCLQRQPILRRREEKEKEALIRTTTPSYINDNSILSPWRTVSFNNNSKSSGSFKSISQRWKSTTTSIIPTTTVITDDEDESSSSSSSSQFDNNYKYIEIRSTDDDDGKGRGLFATKEIPIGTLVMCGRSITTTSTKRNSHTIQIDWNKHLIMDEPAILVNHSCDYQNKVNVGIKPNQYGAYDFIAIKHIQIGEEILWDYETTESQIDGFSKCFDCSSNKEYCRGRLYGYLNSTAKKEIIEKYGKQHIAPYLFTK